MKIPSRLVLCAVVLAVVAMLARVFTMGRAGQTPHDTRFLMNQILTKSDSGWRVSSILPIAVAGAPK